MAISALRRRSGSILALAVCILILSTGVFGADDRFKDNGDGTVTDTKTGLMWAQTDNMGNITWHDARLYCENIILSKYRDWRMPTVEELKTLFDANLERRETVCGKKVNVAPEIGLSCGFVWSSQEESVSDQYPISAMAYEFAKGYPYSARKSQYRGYRALPVRNAK